MKRLQKFTAVHSSVYNHFNSGRSLSSRAEFKFNRDAALAEWCQWSMRLSVISGTTTQEDAAITTRAICNAWDHAAGLNEGRNHIADGMVEVAEKEVGEPIEIPHRTFHDLRRTAATGMARLGIPVRVTEAVLNHVSGTGGGIVGV